VADDGVISGLGDADLLGGGVTEVTIRATARHICGRYGAKAEGEG